MPMMSGMKRIYFPLCSFILVFVLYTSNKDICSKVISFWTTLTHNRIKPPRPHILLIVADDLGYNDIGYHNPAVLTPTLDQLAREGVTLENYYVQPCCTPSRSALLSGRHAIHTGLQHKAIYVAQRKGLPLRFKTLADRLVEVGYSTNMVGKWHIGFFKKEYTPNYRGFQNFFGSLGGKVTHTLFQLCIAIPRGQNNARVCGVDLHANMSTVYNTSEYSTYLYTMKAVEIIKNHDPRTPLFLYLSFQAVHQPLQVPKNFWLMYPDEENKKRRRYLGMVTCLDKAVAYVKQAMKQAGMWDDTVTVFTTDNGANPNNGGSNYPLRGRKSTLWEGGIKAVGLIHSKLLAKRGYVNKELVDISDWYPTLLHLAGVNTSDEGLDGWNQWETLSENRSSLRSEILHNIDPRYRRWGKPLFNNTFDTRILAAIRVGDWKLLTGFQSKYDLKSLGNSSLLLSRYGTLRSKNVWLFNIKQDPSEQNDLSNTKLYKVKMLLDHINMHKRSAVKPQAEDNDLDCDPSRNGYAWKPWVEDG